MKRIEGTSTLLADMEKVTEDPDVASAEISSPETAYIAEEPVHGYGEVARNVTATRTAGLPKMSTTEGEPNDRPPSEAVHRAPHAIEENPGPVSENPGEDQHASPPSEIDSADQPGSAVLVAANRPVPPYRTQEDELEGAGTLSATTVDNTGETQGVNSQGGKSPINEEFNNERESRGTDTHGETVPTDGENSDDGRTRDIVSPGNEGDAEGGTTEGEGRTSTIVSLREEKKWGDLPRDETTVLELRAKQKEDLTRKLNEFIDRFDAAAMSRFNGLAETDLNVSTEDGDRSVRVVAECVGSEYVISLSSYSGTPLLIQQTTKTPGLDLFLLIKNLNTGFDLGDPPQSTHREWQVKFDQELREFYRSIPRGVMASAEKQVAKDFTFSDKANRLTHAMVTVAYIGGDQFDLIIRDADRNVVLAEQRGSRKPRMDLVEMIIGITGWNWLSPSDYRFSG